MGFLESLHIVENTIIDLKYLILISVTLQLKTNTMPQAAL